MTPLHIVIHHSASKRDVTAREIREWHMRKGWSDIGYHYVIEGDAKVVRGRRPNVTGAHSRGFNRDSIGICIVGDNTRLGQRWTAAQVRAAKELIAALQLVWGPMDVRPHREAGTTITECPGLNELPATLEV
jgi:N-acetylmuramoyl-L-alanine amidase